MNQTIRQVKDKCILCGREVYLRQVYDKRLSEYVTIGEPLCMDCWRHEIIGEQEVQT